MSHYEGFGIATMEAMACGCAVVVTPTGFGSDLRDCVDAVVCDFLDEERMQAQILSLLSDDARRIRIARAGWQRVQDMRWDRQEDALAEVYRGGWRTGIARLLLCNENEYYRGRSAS